MTFFLLIYVCRLKQKPKKKNVYLSKLLFLLLYTFDFYLFCLLNRLKLHYLKVKPLYSNGGGECVGGGTKQSDTNIGSTPVF